jgi:hypothetical protein
LHLIAKVFADWWEVVEKINLPFALRDLSLALYELAAALRKPTEARRRD